MADNNSSNKEIFKNNINNKLKQNQNIRSDHVTKNIECIGYEIKYVNGRKKIRAIIKFYCQTITIEQSEIINCGFSNIALCEDINCIQCSDKRFNFDNYQNKNIFERGGIFKGNENKLLVKKNSSKKLDFECISCQHKFNMSPSKITNEKRMCPYCVKSHKKLCGSDNCKSCKENSLLKRENIMDNWSPNNKKKPYEISKYGNEEILLTCSQCKDDCSPRQIRTIGETNKFYCQNCEESNKNSKICIACNKENTNKNYDKCKCCRGKEISSIPLCGDNECKTCFERSFKSVESQKCKSCYFDEEKNKISANKITKNSGRELWFTCNECDKPFKSKLHGKKTITCQNKYCIENGNSSKNKSEKKLLENLSKDYSNIVSQPKYDWCKNPNTNYYLPFDYELPGNIIIELDGPQHIDTQIANWKTPSEQQTIDKYKMELAISNGKSIIRILQEDVWNDKNNWQEELKKNIDLLKNDNDTKIICIGDCDIYNEYNTIYNQKSYKPINI